MSGQLSPRKQEKYDRLVRLGQEAYKEGDFARAHQLWRHAAMIHSSDETLWILLLSVLEQAQDQRVCLQNILILNPDNHLARKMISNLDAPPGTP